MCPEFANEELSISIGCPNFKVVREKIQSRLSASTFEGLSLVFTYNRVMPKMKRDYRNALEPGLSIDIDTDYKTQGGTLGGIVTLRSTNSKGEDLQVGITCSHVITVNCKNKLFIQFVAPSSSQPNIFFMKVSKIIPQQSLPSCRNTF